MGGFAAHLPQNADFTTPIPNEPWIFVKKIVVGWLYSINRPKVRAWGCIKTGEPWWVRLRWVSLGRRLLGVPAAAQPGEEQAKAEEEETRVDENVG